MQEMPPYGTRDIQESKLASFTEAECAEWKRSRGKNIIEFNGQYWLEIKKGFYQTSNLLSKCDYKHLSLPFGKAWGLRAALSPQDVKKANIYLHMHILDGDDLKNYDLSSLSSNRRNQIKRSFKRCEFVELLDDQLLRRDGYSVYLSSSERIGRESFRSEAEYLPRCGLHINNGDNKHIVIAGLVDGKLGGYIEAHAVDGVAYLETANFHSEALSSYVSIGLHYHLIRICKESPDIHTLVHGQVSSFNESLRIFKKSIKFKEVPVPAVMKVLPLLAPFTSILIKKGFGAKIDKVA